jgi:hypothetical protein|tara:strand:+ start:438 stop:701 length:264 start_codon:yes stop_codon:yes gene_type:complete
MSKVTEKISEEQLAELKNLQQEINSSLMNIGNTEIVKSQLLQRHTKLESDWKILSESLEKEYGSVNINLQDGTISEIEKEEAPLQKA